MYRQAERESEHNETPGEGKSAIRIESDQIKFISLSCTNLNLKFETLATPAHPGKFCRLIH
uniref:Uncharacterized protein n=1 Tax=Kalanchoe fedtschenkoi TaxID=63787 RepID=A0A7N0USS6_KALFE